MQKSSSTVLSKDINRINFEKIRPIKVFMRKMAQLKIIEFLLGFISAFTLVFLWLNTTSIWWNALIVLVLGFVFSKIFSFPVILLSPFILKYNHPELYEQFFKARTYITHIEAKNGFIWQFISPDLYKQAKLGKNELDCLKNQSMYSPNKIMDYLTYYEVVEFLQGRKGKNEEKTKQVANSNYEGH